MEENHKIITEFMEYIKVPKIYPKDKQILRYKNRSFYEDSLKFDKDWNLLMEVVEKIESIKDSYHGRFGVYISSNSCTIQSTNFRPDKPIPNPPHYYNNVVLNNKIESVYYSIIYFINFYNKQKEE